MDRLPLLSMWRMRKTDTNTATLRDIDIAKMEPTAIDSSKFEHESVDPPLYFDTFDVERRLVHPDWQLSTVDFTKIVGTSHLEVRLLHPLDLIITKLERADSQDLEDGQLLFERYPEDITVITERVREAARYYPLNERIVNQVAYSFTGIFQQTIDLSDLL